MGVSAWRPDTTKGHLPLPLMRNYDIVEQPTNLNLLTEKMCNFTD